MPMLLREIDTDCDEVGRSMLKLIDLLNDESGATAIEYGLIASLIAVAIIAGAKAIGVNLNTMFGNIATTLNNP